MQLLLPLVLALAAAAIIPPGVEGVNTTTTSQEEGQAPSSSFPPQQATTTAGSPTTTIPLGEEEETENANTTTTILPSSNGNGEGKDWNGYNFPTSLTIKAGVFVAPPFATLDETSGEFGGFQVDLLRSIENFAKQNDNITLQFNLSQSPDQYTSAFDLVASDCKDLAGTVGHFHKREDCDKFDIIVANYYATASRLHRAVLSPAFLTSSISALKYLDKSTAGTSQDYTTLSEAQAAQAPICLKEGAYYATVVRNKFPTATYFPCRDQATCVQSLKQEDCVLYADDELTLLYASALDPSLQVTGETFNTQYIVFAYKRSLPPTTLFLLDKWMRDAITNATTDELYYKYFQKEICPIGSAGLDCDEACDPDHGKANLRGECICQSTKWTGDDCSMEVLENVNSLSRGMVTAAYGMFGINVLTILVCGMWLYWKRQSTQVVCSQPSFLLLVLVGCFISSSTIVAMAQEDDGKGRSVPACVAIPWLYSVGFCVTFGTLFAKIRRIYIIFRNAANFVRTIVTVQETLAVIAAVLVVDIIILVLWTAIDPLRWQRDVVSEDIFGESLESIGYCTSEYWTVWASLIASLHLALMAVACYMCYVARDIPTRFAEGKYISIAMISNLQIFVVGVPILVIIGADPQTGFFVRSVIIWMNDFVVVTLIFGNLIYSVHFDPATREDGGPRESVGSIVGSAMQQYRSSKALGSSRDLGSSSRRLGASSRLSDQALRSSDQTQPLGASRLSDHSHPLGSIREPSQPQLEGSALEGRNDPPI